MQKQLKLALAALCCAQVSVAQNNETKSQENTLQSEQVFTFTEAQLGEDDDQSQNVTIINAGNNVYASEVGYLFSPVRFRYRAFNQKFNDVYINGVQMNDLESGQFRFSSIGGINNITKNVDFALPFEKSNFAVSAMGGSNNYNFRASKVASGQRLTLSGANRNYTLRGMYSFGTGVSEKGWSFAGSIGYRWADRGYVEGTFYNSLSYFFGIEKQINDQHSISLATWGNPTERASQGASSDEVYWLANDNYYNPYWGYQNGKKRNSRVVNDFSPSALLTWDFKIGDDTKLTTSLFGKYSMYQSTKLNYNNTDNPQPDYWKNLPSANYDVWNQSGTDQDILNWQTSYNYWTACKANRQIDFDELYFANRQAAAQGADAMYYIQAKHIDNFNLTLSSALNTKLGKNTDWNLGVALATNTGKHYQTMEDLLGASTFHNINTYAVGSYAADSKEVQYDLNHPNAVVKEGDKFGYNYNLLVNKATAWTSLSTTVQRFRFTLGAKMAGTSMQRDGKMRNGFAENNSYGKSGTARFLDGGGKLSIAYTPGRGHYFLVGAGYEWRAPQATTAFMAPEINNDFVTNLKNEHIFSSEVSYNYRGSWLNANISGYYSRMEDVTEWQNFYYDDINSFTYVSMTGIEKEYYGVELGLKFKLASFLDLKAIGTVSEAKNVNNANVWYMSSVPDDANNPYNDNNNHQAEKVANKNMRESGTPLTALSLGLSYHQNGWYIDLNGNYYDRIYLSYSPNYRYESTLKTRQKIEGNVFDNQTGELLESAVAQAKGKGGFMLDLSIGRSIYLRKGSLSINLSITNLLNNQELCTGGYEQSRSNYNVNEKVRTYKFDRNPKKYYAYGTNGMLNIAYKF